MMEKSTNKEEEAIFSKDDTGVNELFTLMQGPFNPEKQSILDSLHYNISLHIHPKKGNRSYVEQAKNSM